MRTRRIALTALSALAITAATTAVAPAKTSHEGWPNIDGAFRQDKANANVTYRGTAKSDELLGAHGSDTLYGRDRADVLWGDWNPDGQPTTQTDHIYGGAGDDWIYASHGTNVISGGAGNDTIRAHWGQGTIDCGAGRDTLFVSHRARPHYKIRNCETISYKTLGY